MINLKNFSAYIANKQIIKEITYSFLENKTYVVMGKNGSGKSTLLQALSGNKDYSITGEANLSPNIDLKLMKTEEFFLQDIFLSPQIPISIHGISHINFFKEIINNKNKFSNLPEVNYKDLISLIKERSMYFKFEKDYLTRYFNEGFSGGEKKRNEILQIDVFKPKIILLDEIDSGLDIDNMNFISNYLRTYKATKIIVTHYPEFAASLNPDVLLILNDGTIVGEIKKQEIKKELENIKLNGLEVKC